MNEISFSEIIKAELKRRKIPAKKFAREMGFNYSAFNEFLRGTQETFPLKKIEKTLDKLEIKIVTL
jgi:hypothetical protein